MAAYFHLTLDTTAPSACSVSCISATGSPTLALTLSANGATQMKLWGSILGQETEAAASFETYQSEKVVTLSAGDGTKTIYVKFRDGVGNTSAVKSCTTVLDTTAPTITLTGPDVSTISKVSGYDACAFSFMANEAFTEYSVRVVPLEGSAHTAGIQLPTAGGSQNMGGTGSFAANTAVSCVVKGTDLHAATTGDGVKIIKVFVKDALGNWSV